MNAQDIITEVDSIVQNLDERSLILRHVNTAQKMVAEEVMLPGLKNGYATVTTVLGERFVALPDAYHKGLYYAQRDGKDINIHLTDVDMVISRGSMSSDDGDVTDIAESGDQLVYQSIPSTVVDIEIGFYKLPIEMTDEDTSSPDGARNNAYYDLAIIHMASSICFSNIEDGIEGAKVNTSFHRGEFEKNVSELKKYAKKKGILVPIRPSSGRQWLGTL